MSSKFLDKTGLDTLWAKIKSTFQTLGNMVKDWGDTPSDTKYPSEKLVKTSLDAKAPNAVTTESAIATGDKLLFSDASDSSKTKRMITGFDTGVTNTLLRRDGTFAKALYADEGWGGSFGTALAPMDTYLLQQRNCFFGAKPSAIKVEYSTDGGSTWIDYGLSDLQKQALFSQYDGISVACGKHTHILPTYTGSIVGTKDLSNANVADQRLRITICCRSLATEGTTSRTDLWLYAVIRRVGIYMSTNAASKGPRHCVFSAKTRKDFNAGNDTWTNFGDYAIFGDSGWNSIPCNNKASSHGMTFGDYQDRHYSAFRFEVWSEGVNDSPNESQTGNMIILKIVAFSELCWLNKSSNAQLANYGMPCTVNASTGSASFPNGITSDVAIPISSGGTGATTAIGAEYNILNQVADIDTTINGDHKIALCNQTKSASNGVFRWLKLSNVWTWIKGLLSSESGVNISGNAATATTATTAAGYTSGGAIDTALQGKATPADITKAIQDLDVASQGGDGKYIKAIYETDGKISATEETMDTAPTANSTNAVTSGGVKTALDGKQDDLGISSEGDTTKFLNAAGQWAVPSSNVRSYYSSPSYFGVKFATTTVTGTEATSYGVFQFTRLQIGTNIKTLSGNAQKPIVGIVQIFQRTNKAGETLPASVTARITVLQSDYTGQLRVYFKINGNSVDWYIATTTAKEFVAWRTLKLFGSGSVNDIELAGVNDVSDLTENNATYKTPLVEASSTGTGDSSTPVYVDSNGMLVSCNEMLHKSGSNATSGCADALLSALPNWTATPTDTTKLIRRDMNGSASFGQVTFLTVWNYILSKFPSLGWTGSSAKTLSEDVYNYLIGASITFSVNVTLMREATPYRVYVNWHGNILTIKNTSGSPISMAVGTVGTVSVANNNTYALPDLAPTTWTFFYDGNTLYAVPSSSVKYSLTESSSILAARATGDGSGNTISSTYAKKDVESVSNGSYGSNIGYIAPTALCVIGDSHTASSYSVEDIISKTMSASYRHNNGRLYVILNTKSSSVKLTGFVNGTWDLVAGMHTTVVRWNGAYYRQD